MASVGSIVGARFIGPLAGQYVLASREGDGEGGVKILACRTRSITTRVAVLQAPVAGKVGERLALRLDGLGLLHGTVAGRTEDGFAADLELTDHEREKLAGKIEWLQRKKLRLVEDRRGDKRWTPRASRTKIILPTGQVLDCFIINVSRSGVAVSADTAPQLGAPLAVGGVMGRVVRNLVNGFAVQFASAQDPASIESLLAPQPEGRGEAIAKTLADIVARQEKAPSAA